MNYKSKHEKWYGQKLKFKIPPQPSDIIWEHAHVSSDDQVNKIVLGGILISFILFVAFVLFSTLYKSKEGVVPICKYPTDSNSKWFYEMQEQDAFDEWIAISKEKFTTFPGNLHCYCQKLSGLMGNNMLKNQIFRSTRKTVDAGKTFLSGKMCKEWVEHSFYVSLASYGLGFLINILNSCLYLLIKAIIISIGYWSR